MVDYKDGIQEAYEEISEAKTDVNKVVDAITRTIIGDQKVGINQLKNLLPIQTISMDSDIEFNNNFGKLFISIKKAISPYIK